MIEKEHRKSCRRIALLRLLLVAGLLGAIGQARALVLTPYFESILVKNVSTGWTTVSLDNTYLSAVPVCTYALGTFAGSNPNYTDPPAVPRIRNITSNTFQLRIQGWEDSSASPANVHCMVMEEGAHTLPDGRKVEAHTVISDKTSGQYSSDGGWTQSLLEDVSGDIVHNYTNPVVVGQVISHNDPRASVIYVSDCDARQNHPFQSGMADGICVGKHIGMIADTRAPETIGYIVGETGSGTLNNVFYELAFGSDTVAGNNTSNSGFSYPLSRRHTMGVLTQGGEDGGNGSWAVLYGSDPLTPTSMALAVDEEIFSGDTTRNHTREPVYYWAFAGAEITLVKNLINDDGGTASLADFILSAVGSDTVTGVSGTTNVTKAVVEPGTYILSETIVPGYTAGNWVCTGATKFSVNQIELVGGDHAVCTITNDDEAFSTLTLVKDLSNDAGGTAALSDFTLSFNGAGGSGSGVNGDAAITNVTVAPGSYALTETAIPGYSLDAIQCDGSDADGLDGVDVQAGEKITCVYVNDDQGVDLTIGKTVNDTSPNIGDTLVFTLDVSNSGPDSATNVQVLDQVPAGFSYLASSISGGDVRNDTSPASSGLAWTINLIPAGSSVSLTFQATVLAP